LGFCLKKDGTVCHVVKAGKKCVAAASNDTAPVLLSLDARVVIAGPNGARELPLSSFYVPDGIVNTALEADELVTEVRVPLAGRTVCGYQKVRIRASIDYPALTVAVAARLSAERRVEQVRIVVSALGARPHAIGRLEAFAGRALDAAAISELAALAHKQCTPLTNINVDPAWRKDRK